MSHIQPPPVVVCSHTHTILISHNRFPVALKLMSFTIRYRNSDNVVMLRKCYTCFSCLFTFSFFFSASLPPPSESLHCLFTVYCLQPVSLVFLLSSCPGVFIRTLNYCITELLYKWREQIDKLRLEKGCKWEFYKRKGTKESSSFSSGKF